MNDKGIRNLKPKIDWNQSLEQAFIELETSLSQAEGLVTPYFTKRFGLDVAETDRVVNGVLFPKKGGEPHQCEHEVTLEEIHYFKY